LIQAQKQQKVNHKLESVGIIKGFQLKVQHFPSLRQFVTKIKIEEYFDTQLSS
jgi:hypothetical protein